MPYRTTNEIEEFKLILKRILKIKTLDIGGFILKLVLIMTFRQPKTQ